MTSIAAPGCTYDLALTALSSHLVTYQPYTIGGVTFEPPNGTLYVYQLAYSSPIANYLLLCISGLPYFAMQHFTNEVASTPFEEEHRQYCLPVLDPHLITCEEEHFIQDLGRTNTSLVKYEVLEMYAPANASTPNNETKWQAKDYRVYRLALDYTNETHREGYDSIKYRTSDEGNGTMTVMMHPNPKHLRESILTGTQSFDIFCELTTSADYDMAVASNSGDASDGDYGYASLLHYLMYDEWPDVPAKKAPDGNFYFAAKCQLAFIHSRDDYLSSWRKVDFTLKNGVSHANVTEERCPNARDSRPPGEALSGFNDLNFALEGAAAVLSSSDGYSKLFNVNPHQELHGTHIWGGMSRLDAVVNQIYHLVQTAYTESTHYYAMKNNTIYENPILMTRYPHLYVIRISWTPTTYIGLALSLLITLNAWLLAWRWYRATYRFGLSTDTWNLLRPVDLMAYSLAAYHDLRGSLDSFEHRRMAMRGEVGAFLREWPTWEAGKHSQSQLVINSGPQSPASTQSPVTPMNYFDAKAVSPTQVPRAEPGPRTGLPVERRDDDLEK